MARVELPVTAEELGEVARGRRVELVRGKVVEMTPVGRPHGRTVVRLAQWMNAYVEENQLGEVSTELGVVLARDPDLVRAPDLAFLSLERLAGARPEGYVEGAPDLVVEVLSPDDRASEVQEKVEEYLGAGAGVVLVADPRTGTVTAYRPGGEARVYRGVEALSCAPALPGFTFRPADLFRTA